MRFLLCLLTAISMTAQSAEVRAEDELFQDGDLIVLLGGTFVERAQEYGHIEAAIQLANPNKKLHFRNLGWSGDTVWAESRGEFDPPAKGYERMIQQITEMKPDVIIFGYGNAESFNGPEGVEPFKKQYRKLVSDLPAAKRVFLSPVLPNASDFRTNRVNQRLLMIGEYEKAARFVASEFAGLFIDVSLREIPGSLYDGNGMHLNNNGYGAVAQAIAPGYEFIADGLGASASKDLPELLDAIIAKNRLVFYRWRPQNITYLALFRKHEQGNNYAEIPMFDPLIDQADQKIDRLKREIATARGKINNEGRKAGS